LPFFTFYFLFFLSFPVNFCWISGFLFFRY
jgi:hypothetical protein